MSNKANIKNQFNIPYDSINDNLDEINKAEDIMDIGPTK